MLIKRLFAVLILILPIANAHSAAVLSFDLVLPPIEHPSFSSDALFLFTGELTVDDSDYVYAGGQTFINVNSARGQATFSILDPSDPDNLLGPYEFTHASGEGDYHLVAFDDRLVAWPYGTSHPIFFFSDGVEDWSLALLPDGYVVGFYFLGSVSGSHTPP